MPPKRQKDKATSRSPSPSQRASSHRSPTRSRSPRRSRSPQRMNIQDRLSSPSQRMAARIKAAETRALTKRALQRIHLLLQQAPNVDINGRYPHLSKEAIAVRTLTGKYQVVDVEKGYVNPKHKIYLFESSFNNHPNRYFDTCMKIAADLRVLEEVYRIMGIPITNAVRSCWVGRDDAKNKNIRFLEAFHESKQARKAMNPRGFASRSPSSPRGSRSRSPERDNTLRTERAERLRRRARRAFKDFNQDDWYTAPLWLVTGASTRRSSSRSPVRRSSTTTRSSSSRSPRRSSSSRSPTRGSSSRSPTRGSSSRSPTRGSSSRSPRRSNS
jgi:hypothetical protein